MTAEANSWSLRLMEAFIDWSQTNERHESNRAFPVKLSDTGLFTSVKDQTPAPGVMPYSINAHHWSDHTTSQQWFALPGLEKLGVYPRERYDFGQVKGYFDFPYGTVFAKTVSIQLDETDPSSEDSIGNTGFASTGSGLASVQLHLE